MLVNSRFTRFLTNQLVLKCGISILLFAIFSSSSSFRDPSDRSFLSKEVNILIRQIGHRLLLQAGDSTSRVMPVTETKEGIFVIRFENNFNFHHDSLQALVQTFLPKSKFPSGYTVTVLDCTKGEIIYGFQVNSTTPDILPCKGRTQPQGCYMMEFAFPDLYQNTGVKSAINPRNSVSKTDHPGINPASAGLNSSPITDIDPQTKELKSVAVDVGNSNPVSKGIKTSAFNFTANNLAYAGMLVLLVAGILIWNIRKTSKPIAIQSQEPAIVKESISEMPSLGKFLFNVKGQRLHLGDEVISLTDKECKVLELLHRDFGELIPRENLMQEIWINEGVITGRSLDMFVSKLRKKLSADPELRITNVHGKGYKLEIAES